MTLVESNPSAQAPRPRSTPPDLAELFDRYYEEVRQFVLGKTMDFELAADATQQAFLELWQKWPQRWLLGEGKNVAYLKKTAYHRAIDQKRSRTRVSTQPIPEQPFTDDNFCRIEFVADWGNTIRNAVLNMSVEKRTMLARHMEGVPPSEIAEELGMKPSTVSTHLSRIYAQLRRIAGTDRGEVR